MNECTCPNCNGTFSPREVLEEEGAPRADRRDLGKYHRIRFDGQMFHVETYEGEIVESCETLREARKMLDKQELHVSRTADIVDINDGSLRLDRRQRQAWVEGHPIVLTKIEYALLQVLIAEPLTVFSRDELQEKVWGYTSDSSRSLDTHLRRLRAKLGGGRDRFVVNSWGVGYRLMDSTEQPTIKTGEAS